MLVAAPKAGMVARFPSRLVRPERNNRLSPMSGLVRRPSIAVLVAMSALGPLALNIFMPSMPGLARQFEVEYGTVSADAHPLSGRFESGATRLWPI